MDLMVAGGPQVQVAGTPEDLVLCLQLFARLEEGQPGEHVVVA
jgi:hypothetical protein